MLVLLSASNKKEIFRRLFLFFLINLLVLSVVIAYAEATAVMCERGESVCSFKKTFGIYCPGCGGSRSLLALTRFDFLSSLILFPALIPSVIIFIAADILFLASIIKGSLNPIKRFPISTLISIPLIILLNFALRNYILIFWGIDYVSDIKF